MWFSDLSETFGVNITNNEKVWTADNDTIVLRPFQWTEYYTGYQVVYLSDQAHPTDPHLTIISAFAYSEKLESAIGIVAIYDTRTGQRVVDSGVLGPKPADISGFVLARWVDTPVDGSSALVFHLLG